MAWYKKARRGTDRALMDYYTEFPYDVDPYYAPTDPTVPGYSLSKPNPFFGGKTRNTPGFPKLKYPQNYSMNEDESGVGGTGYDEIQPGRTILDDDIPVGEGANDERFVDYSDKLKRPGTISDNLDKGRTGPHNMPHGGLFTSVRNRVKNPFVRSL